MTAITSQLLVPRGPWIPGEAAEQFFPWLDGGSVRRLKDLLVKPVRERIAVLMSGSYANFGTIQLQNLLLGKTAYAGATTIYGALYTAAIDDTLLGNTSNEATYGSYARMSLTNNTTNFAAGTGTTSYVKTFPSDAVHSWATSTATSNTITYLGFLDGNAGSSADKGLLWCSVTSTTILSGDTPQLAQNAVSVTLD